jgi:hypothetical protein
MRTPFSASSWRSDWLNANTKAFVAPYTPLSVSGAIATLDPMFTIVPEPRFTNAGAIA